MLDLVIRNGLVVDGTGAPARRGDVGLRGDRIAAVGDLGNAEARRSVDAAGRVVAPGFVDLHSHADWSLLVDPRAESAVRQGVTTMIVGNCGHGPTPLRRAADVPHLVLGHVESPDVSADWHDMGGYLRALERRQPAINVGTFVGHNAVRVAVLGFEQRAARPDEVAAMRRLVAEAMDAGAFGMSTGLEYPLGRSATTAEVIELAREAARGGIYATHARDRVEGAEAALDEAITICQTAGLPLQFSHLAPRVWAPAGATGRMVRRVETVRAGGLDAAFDSVCYGFGCTSVASLLPGWAFDGGVARLVERLGDTAARERIKAYDRPFFRFVLTGEWDRMALFSSQRSPELIGLTFAEIAERRGQAPHDAILDLMAEEGEGLYGMLMAAQSQSLEEIKATIRHPACCVESDGLTLAPDGSMAGVQHPYTYGWAARLLGQFVREDGLLSLEEAVFKLTGFPAGRVGLRDRGRLAPGLAGDVVVFDPATVRDATTLREPATFPPGIGLTVVNGAVAYDGHATTGARAGSVLRRGAA
jgi:N-acyl-D-amino-acid deacylase